MGVIPRPINVMSFLVILFVTMKVRKNAVLTAFIFKLVRKVNGKMRKDVLMVVLKIAVFRCVGQGSENAWAKKSPVFAITKALDGKEKIVL